MNKALSFLTKLHDATIQEDAEHRNKGEIKPVHAGRLTFITLALLDFVSYEGILPFLSAGVGLLPERRPKSVLKHQHVRNEEHSKSSDGEEILLLVIEQFLLVLKDGDEGIAPIIRERCLGDLLAGLCELAIGPKTLRGSEKFKDELDELLAR